MGIYIPGIGFQSDEIVALNVALRKYDENLSFRLNERDGNYCIFQRLPERAMLSIQEGTTDFPVKTFQPKGRIPGVDECMKWVYEQDSWRQDHLEQVQRHNKRLRAQKDAAFQEVNREGAERLEFIARTRDGIDTGRVVSGRRDGKRRRVFSDIG